MHGSLDLFSHLPVLDLLDISIKPLIHLSFLVCVILNIFTLPNRPFSNFEVIPGVFLWCFVVDA